jgi:c(7)-type cytochrome triheme protein
MTSCDPCHAPAAGEPDPPKLQPAVYEMKGSFSHGKHAARGGGGKLCATCHAAVMKSDDQYLPRPDAKTCATAGCHDGTVFAITAACTRCHADPGKSIERPKLERFSHAHHAVAQLPCASCHVVKGTEVVSVGHAACAKCHADEFGTLKPHICLACHQSIEPWRHLIVDRLPPPATEFGATLRHDHHDKPCADCHKLDTAGHELRTPRGHASCNGCHLASGGPAPQLGECEGCHSAGLQSMRDIVRAGAAWSVRKKFHHARHTASACTDCHTDLHAASVAELATPAKATCARCHEGRTAFKLTGTTCTRCHPGAR